MLWSCWTLMKLTSPTRRDSRAMHSKEFKGLLEKHGNIKSKEKSMIANDSDENDLSLDMYDIILGDVGGCPICRWLVWTPGCYYWHMGSGGNRGKIVSLKSSKLWAGTDINRLSFRRNIVVRHLWFLFRTTPDAYTNRPGRDSGWDPDR